MKQHDVIISGSNMELSNAIKNMVCEKVENYSNMRIVSFECV